VTTGGARICTTTVLWEGESSPSAGTTTFSVGLSAWHVPALQISPPAQTGLQTPDEARQMPSSEHDAPARHCSSVVHRPSARGLHPEAKAPATRAAASATSLRELAPS
jgi:hypothetical protein